ncbi:hypothetical protein C0K13_21160 [Salmonella enterica]|nr:hypothetical protein [Salmonella enterica]EAW2005093.1 hypothetical protein [Salmonella enterica subsp. enterica]EBB9987804.1 hypothetical protein [Salmonella enterica subsp. enterica serovar Montevideo]EAQ7272031.1 hypothetical protein [Salmonella enterica]EAT4005112.1 hypothetical protein [Salmonella enterica]
MISLSPPTICNSAQKNLLLKIDFIFLTQVKINLLEVSVRRHWKRRDRCNAFQINVKRVYFGCY